MPQVRPEGQLYGQVRPEQGSQGMSAEQSWMLFKKQREEKQRLGPLGYFWSTVSSSLGSLAPWQARMFLQYIFTTNAVPGGALGGRTGAEKILTGQKGRATGGLSYKSIIGQLAGIAGGSIKTRWQDKAQKSGWFQNTMASQTKMAAQSGVEVTAGVNQAIANRVLQGNIAPPGWKGVTSLMYARAKFGSFWNPFEGGAGGFAQALISGNPVTKFSTTAMEKWGAEDLEDWDAIGPTAANTMLQQSTESRREFEMERRSKRGGGGLDALFGMAASTALPIALGGVLGSAGKALSGLTKPSDASSMPMETGFGDTGAERGFFDVGKTMERVPDQSTFLSQLGNLMQRGGGYLAPSLKDSFGSFSTAGPPRVPGTKDIKYPYIAGGEKGVPGYWPEPWKKEALWETKWGEYPEEMRELLRQGVFEENPYGYGNRFWTPPRGMTGWGF